MKRIFSLLLAFSLILGLLPGRVSATEIPEEAAEPHAETTAEPATVDIDAIYQTTGDFIASNISAGITFDDEWIVLGLIRSGREVPDFYYENVVSYVQANINSNEQLHQYKSVDNSRLILALTAIGKDVTDVGGHNLLTGLNSLDYLKWQGINGVIWGLIAIDSYDYEISGGDVTRETLIQTILADQLSDGGWSLIGLPSDPDVTAMAVQSLAPYYQSNPAVKSAIDTALNTLAQMQDSDGGFSTYGDATCESSAQVIVALTALGINPHTDSRFVKNSRSVVDALCDYYVDGGGFCHLKGDMRDDLATQQGYYALCAYQRFLRGEPHLMDMRDVAIESKPETPEAPSEATDPTEDIAPTEETEPSEGTDPTEETDPSETTIPTEETEPSESTEPTEPEKEIMGLKESEILGYATVSFVDYGKREEGQNIFPQFQNPLGTIVGATQVPYKEGDSVASVSLRLLESRGITASYSGTAYSNFYLAAIGNFTANSTYYSNFGEFDAGSRSGWMVSINGAYISRGASGYAACNGDSIQWLYTCQLGADIGDTQYTQTVENVEKLINAIGTVILEKKDEIEAARAAYEKLNADQKVRVSNYDVLEAAEKKLAQLQASEEDKEKVQEVEQLIDAISEVTFSTEWKIEDARKAYDALTENQKSLVDNYNKLIAAENQLERLKKPSAEEVFQNVGDYMVSLGTPMVGAIGGEWMVIGLVRSGREVPADYYGIAEEYVKANINDQEQLHRAKSSENARMIMALTAMGEDVTNVAGHNLLLGLTDMDFVTKQGVNGPIWTLMAFDSGSYDFPEGNVSREGLVDYILSQQLSDGGWALSGEKADADMTGMALQALAPYYKSNDDVKKALDQALATLSEMQNENGSFSSVDGENAESIAQVIVGLTALGIDPEKDERFMKQGISAVDALCEYYISGGGFCHIMGEDTDGMATEQGYYALTAYFRFVEGKTALYDMSDVELSTQTEPTEVTTEPTETSEETVPETTEPVVKEETESGSFMWLLWVFLIAVALVVIAIVYIKKRNSGGRYAR